MFHFTEQSDLNFRAVSTSPAYSISCRNVHVISVVLGKLTWYAWSSANCMVCCWRFFPVLRGLGCGGYHVIQLGKD